MQKYLAKSPFFIVFILFIIGFLLVSEQTMNLFVNNLWFIGAFIFIFIPPLVFILMTLIYMIVFAYDITQNKDSTLLNMLSAVGSISIMAACFLFRKSIAECEYNHELIFLYLVTIVCVAILIILINFIMGKNLYRNSTLILTIFAICHFLVYRLFFSP